jgi:hypothetical protein
MDRMTASDLFDEIWKGCYNINIPKKVRDEQRKRLSDRKAGGPLM